MKGMKEVWVTFFIPFIPVSSHSELICDADRGHLPTNIRSIVFSIESRDLEVNIDDLARCQLRTLGRYDEHAFFF